MKKTNPGKLVLVTLICLTVIACIDIRSHKTPDGYYKTYSFAKKLGESIIDTSLSKKENKIGGGYCLVESITDSTQRISFFTNDDSNGPYYDPKNMSVTFAFTSGETTVFEADFNSSATGPGKEYYLISNTTRSRFVFYPYLLSPPSSDRRTLMMDYDEDIENGPTREIRQLYIDPQDTVNFRKTLMDPQKIRKILSSARQDDHRSSH